MSMKNFIFGIDLGTTNSAIAVYTGAGAHVLPVDGRATFPSCVQWHSDGTVTTGYSAYMHKDQPNTVWSAKTFMGTDKVYHLTLEDGNTKDVTPVDVACEVLKAIKERCDISYGLVEEAVITVPAYFNAAQRSDTLRAAEMAGIKVVKLINEPVAGAIAYGFNSDTIKEGDYQEIIVLDVGGGTTDVTKIMIYNFKEVPSLLKDIINPGINFDIVATGGNNHLGGDNYDKYILDDSIGKFLNRHPEYEDGFHKNFTEKSSLASIEAWKSSGKDTDILALPYIDDKESADKIHKNSIFVTKANSDNAYIRFWNEIKECIYECLNIKDSKGNVIGRSNLPSKVILVGGSTKNPRIVESLKNMYDNADDIVIPSPTFADEAVAIGAAIQGAIINKEIGNVYIKDVNPLPIGVEVAEIVNDSIVEGIMYSVIPKDCVLPVKSEFTYRTVDDNQTKLQIGLYQGTEKYIKYNEFIGNLMIDGLPPAPAGEIAIGVQLILDVNGTLTVKANKDGEILKTSFSSILSVKSKETTSKDKNIIAGINNAKTFINSTGRYTEHLTELDNWKIGDPAPNFLKEHGREIREFIAIETKRRMNEFVNAIKTNEFDEDGDE